MVQAPPYQVKMSLRTLIRSQQLRTLISLSTDINCQLPVQRRLPHALNTQSKPRNRLLPTLHPWGGRERVFILNLLREGPLTRPRRKNKQRRSRVPHSPHRQTYTSYRHSNTAQHNPKDRMGAPHAKQNDPVHALPAPLERDTQCHTHKNKNKKGSEPKEKRGLESSDDDCPPPSPDVSL